MKRVSRDEHVIMMSRAEEQGATSTTKQHPFSIIIRIETYLW